MDKGDFIKHLSKENRRPQRHYQEAFNEILEGIKDQLKQGKDIRLLGFGTFYTRNRKPGKARDFKTKTMIETSAVRLAAFRPGKLLKQAVRKKEQPGAKKTKKSLLNRILH